MEANTPRNTRRKPPARPTATPSDAAWHDGSALRLITGLIGLLVAWGAIELLIAGWHWLIDAEALVRMVSQRGAA